MPLLRFLVWTRWECVGSLWGDDFVPRKNSLSLGFVVLEKGGFKAGESVLSVLLSGKAEEGQARPVYVQHLLPVHAKNVFVPFPLLAVGPALSLLLSALPHAAFLLWLVQILLSCLSFALPPLPCWTATAEAIKLLSLWAEKGAELKILWLHLLISYAKS